MRKILIIFSLLLSTTIVFAADETVVQNNQLDYQLQQLKQDVLALSTELSRVEQQLLFPSDTQVNIFLSLTRHTSFVLETARLDIDQKTITSHIYTGAELSALNNGGIQKLFTGNAAKGKHLIALNIVGKNEAGDTVDRTVSYEIDKSAKASYVEAQIILTADGVSISFTDQ